MCEKFYTFMRGSLELSMCYACGLQRRIQDFPDGGGGRQPQKLTPTIIWPNFAKNCMKIKKIGPGDARPKLYYVDAPLVWRGRWFEMRQADVVRKVCT